MKSVASVLAVSTGVAVLSACTATKNVEQVQIDERIETICISHNPDVKNKNFENTLRDVLEEKGITPRSLQGSFAGECEYELYYVAHWDWNLTMPTHVTYIRLNVRRNGQPIGAAEYNASTSVTSIEKLGTARSKLGPLVNELFARQSLLPEEA